MIHCRWKLFLSTAVLSLYFYLIVSKPEIYAQSMQTRLGLFIVSVILTTILISWQGGWRQWLENLFCMIAIVATLHRISIFASDITDSPWSLSWSEGNRYYYASLYSLASNSGMQDTQYSVLHASRYILQSIAFLIPHTTIWFHRLWQVLLWIGSTLTTGWILISRLHKRFNHITIQIVVTYIGWTFLFLLQGPIYYNLLLIVIFVVWQAQPERYSHTLRIVLIASVWAGLSRLNWFPMPGILATSIYILESPLPSRKPAGDPHITKELFRSLAGYFHAPLSWIALGSMTALLTDFLYMRLSALPGSYFRSAFTSPLLWYRLLPNPTNGIGLLPSVILVSLPILLIIMLAARKSRDSYSIVGETLLGILLSVLAIGGLIVSVKIGGGSNLHNMDAFLVLLWLVGTYHFFEVIQPDNQSRGPKIVATRLAWLALLIPTMLTLSAFAPRPLSDPLQDRMDLESIQDTLSDADREVLFLSQPQLVTFVQIQGPYFTSRHDNLLLMEMAMSNNESYLNSFHGELARQKYAYIITDPLYIVYKGKESPFGEENDAWVAEVSEKILCYYEPVLFLKRVKVEILAPRTQTCTAQ